MALTVKHAKTVTIPDPTQAELDAQIALGNYPPGTTLADIALQSDWNANLVVTGQLDIANGGTAASTEDGAIENIVGSATVISPSDVSLAYIPVVDQDGGLVGGKMSIDSMLGTWFVNLGLNNYQMTYYFNGALLGITPSATVGLPLASNGAGVAASFQKIPINAIDGDIMTYGMARGA